MRKVNKVVWGLFLVLSVLLTAPVAGWARRFEYGRTHYYFLPLQLQFTDKETGNPISGSSDSSNVLMKGGQTREFAVDVVDFNKNGRIDIRDFKVWPHSTVISLDIIISGDPDAVGRTPDVSLDIPVPPNLSTGELLRLAPWLKNRFDAAYRSAFWQASGHLHMTKATQDLLDTTLDDIGSNIDRYHSEVNPDVIPPVNLPRRVNLLRVTARQQLGNSGSNFEEQIAQLKYTIYWGPSSILNDDKEREKLVTRAETPEMNILIRPTDQGGQGGDNGGGSCDMLAWGAALLPVPGLLFFLRRRRK